MEGEVDAAVVPPIFLHHHALPGPFREAPTLARKRDSPWESSGLHHVHQQQNMYRPFMEPGVPNPNCWNPNWWNWDSVRFTAKPSTDAPAVICLGTQESAAVSLDANDKIQRSKGEENGRTLLFSKETEENEENLTLKLGGGAFVAEEPILRPSKRVRSGSPGSSATYPMCQVDDCKADLSSAKDYHRRHKVCGFHSKTAKALVGKQMQRFCQQCSRFHPLTEFDEGKRSCRRRLAGHNRRRRKTQPDDAASHVLLPRSQDGKTFYKVRAGNIVDGPASMPSLPDKDRIMQVLNNISSLSSGTGSSKSKLQGCLDLNVLQEAPQQDASQLPSKENESPSAPSTMDLLAVLSTALASTNSNELPTISQVHRDAITADVRSHIEIAHAFPLFGDSETNLNIPSQLTSSEHPVQISTHGIPLQLFNSAEDDSPPKLGSATKYTSSESSNPIEDRSPSCSPPIAKKLFPLCSVPEKNDESLSIFREDHRTVEASTSCGWSRPLELFKDSHRQEDNQTIQNLPYSARYSSSSGSDQSPSSSACHAQDRTGRIIFKLFDKDPSNLPGTLRNEILTWLAHSPSEIESYIRPGCVVLSVYICMKVTAWDELEKNFFARVSSLVKCSDSGFWRNGRFMVCTKSQLASHKDGKIRVCNSWRTLSAPVLTSIFPIAVVSGQETTLILKGRNLTVPGTKIHCTFEGGYSSKEISGVQYPGLIYDGSSLESFILPKGSRYAYGRCFIEVENGLKGNNFPIIVAGAAICQELRTLESEFDELQLQSREDLLHFLNELGWLFQRIQNYPDTSLLEFSTSRFKYLLTFSVERDWSALVRTLLDILAERVSSSDSLAQESIEMLLELQLLSRAVKRKCRKMVELLVNYTVKNALTKDSTHHLFPPNSKGHGGLTPLHIAASMQEAEDVIDALTNDPQEIGLNSWASLLDGSGQSPSIYASAGNHHSYNLLIARKLLDRKNHQLSITIGQGMKSIGKSWLKHESTLTGTTAEKSCAQCALADSWVKLLNHRRGLLQWLYVHPLLAIAAVCVCVCVLLRGAPWVGSVALPFKWEDLEFGPK
ncbi:Squamosa promoter-binding-like protein 14 [Apostasia shenzhenica]|uniref:Squamosa promoter-binding-like protein 14 n=1 Tax=Apostasia shenzhenica TaxID=1088818 RepID=A0A2I0A6B4_9ASPA|nr:Squamosa promoter-binding-like protein 14 [Apostasia shenzhenica]